MSMAKYVVGFDGRWQETFDDRDEAIEWAREVAGTGRIPLRPDLGNLAARPGS